jgi:hypothetical protein
MCLQDAVSVEPLVTMRALEVSNVQMNHINMIFEVPLGSERLFTLFTFEVLDSLVPIHMLSIVGLVEVCLPAIGILTCEGWNRFHLLIMLSNLYKTYNI